MPTNLPPEYYDVRDRLRTAKSTEEKIECMEEMLAVIPKHKGTDKLRADIRQKLSKLKTVSESPKQGSRHESVYHIEREGPARVVVIGAPNVGKSALVAAVTHATPKVSEYPFTTWTPTPGMMSVRDIHIQLIDTPALSREHVEPDLLAFIRTVDFILLMVDLQGRPLEQLDETMGMLEEYRIAFQGEVPRSRGVVAVPGVVLVNKADDEVWDEEFEVLSELLENKWPLLPVSAQTGRNLDQLGEALFERLELMRVYSKLPHKEADRTAPFVLKRGSTVDEFAAKVHHDFHDNLKTARLWGADVHDGQMVGRDHILHDGDVVELHL